MIAKTITLRMHLGARLAEARGPDASQPYCPECGYVEKGPWDVARAPMRTEALSLQCSVCMVRVGFHSMRMVRVFKFEGISVR